MWSCTGTEKAVNPSFPVLLVEKQCVYSMEGDAAHLGLGRQLSQQVPVPHEPLIRLHHRG